MLDIARGKATAAGVESITFTCGTLGEFNAEAGSYDAVLGLNVMHLIADREPVVREVFKILKPGGAFVTSTVCLGHSLLRFIRFVVPLGKLVGLMPDVYVLSEAQFTQELLSGGFEIESKWAHGKNDIALFAIARKPRD